MAVRTQCFRGIRGARRMDTRESAKNGQSMDGAMDGGTFPTRSEIPVLQPASRIDRLEYIADIVQQLRMMSAQADCDALSDLLDRAYQEAVRQRRAGA